MFLIGVLRGHLSTKINGTTTLAGQRRSRDGTGIGRLTTGVCDSDFFLCQPLSCEMVLDVNRISETTDNPVSKVGRARWEDLAVG